jgi:GNAT superfamily N-acetyltransferase
VTDGVTITPLAGEDYRAAIPQLAELLVDAVESGAGVSFLAGVTVEETGRWWGTIEDDVDAEVITPFVAWLDGRIVGSVLLARSTIPNSPHRAEIRRVLVHRSARRRGIASALMRAAEDRARADGRWLLVLDTVTGSEADAFYRSQGWQETGVVPNFALSPDGVPWAATFFWKDLR